ncbi:MAG: DUF3267 domain-containing protein [Bacteroidales bacterium]
MTKRISGERVKVLDADKLERDPHFKKILELDFGDMVPFVFSEIKRRSIISLLYAGVNLGLFILFLYTVINGLTAGVIIWSQVFRQSLAGIFAGSFLIIPIHEMIHGLAYRLLGARKIQFGADMQQFIFYVTVDRYPVSRGQLYLLAMFPFVLINLAAILILLVWAPHYLLLISLLLLSHNIMCIGDFAIVNYVHHIPGKVYSFDVVSEKKSYFFRREDPGGTGS